MLLNQVVRQPGRLRNGGGVLLNQVVRQPGRLKEGGGGLLSYAAGKSEGGLLPSQAVKPG